VSLAEYKYHTGAAYSNKGPNKAIVGSSFDIRWTGKEKYLSERVAFADMCLT